MKRSPLILALPLGLLVGAVAWYLIRRRYGATIRNLTSSDFEASPAADVSDD